MPKFTKETAPTAARNAAKSRVERQQREKIAREQAAARMSSFAALIPRDANFDARQMRTVKQIEKLDDMIAECAKPELIVKLVMAKARLHDLIYPKPGSFRPGKQRREERPPVHPISPVSEHPLGLPMQAPEKPQ